MEFSFSKCKILQVFTHYTKRFSYQMCGIPLEIVEQHDYLGVCLHHRLFHDSLTLIPFAMKSFVS